MRKKITAETGPPPKGVYSPAIVAKGPMVFVSGQGPLDENGEFQFGTFAEQARLTFDNVSKLLEASGTSWEHVVRTGVFLAHLENFQEMNEIYEEYLTEPYPARTTVKAGLPPRMLIEVDCVALVPENES